MLELDKKRFIEMCRRDMVPEDMEWLEKALDRDPLDIGILNAYAVGLLKRNKAGAAVPYLIAANTITQGKNLPVISNLGCAMKLIGDEETALKIFLSMPESAARDNNICTLYINEGNPDAAIKWADSAIKLAANSGDELNKNKAIWNKGLALLEKQDFKEGFKLYEYGLKIGDRPERFYSPDRDEVSWWNMKPTEGIVVLYGEQGIGDEILFSSAIGPILENQKIILDCHPKLEGLFSLSFQNEYNLKAIHPTRKKQQIEWPTKLLGSIMGSEESQSLKYRMAMGSAFGMMCRKSKKPFTREPYLLPSIQGIRAAREWIREQFGDKVVIGVGWHGGSHHTSTSVRTIPLPEWKPFVEWAQKNNIGLLNLQYNEWADEEAEVCFPGVFKYDKRWANPDDLHSQACMLMALDATVSVPQTLVHLAGAIGADLVCPVTEKVSWRYAGKTRLHPFYGPHITMLRADSKDSMEKRMNQIVKALENTI